MPRKILLSFFAAFTIAACGSAPSSTSGDGGTIGPSVNLSSDSGSNFQDGTTSSPVDADPNTDSVNSMGNNPDTTILDAIMGTDTSDLSPDAGSSPAPDAMKMTSPGPDAATPDPTGMRAYVKSLNIVPPAVFYIETGTGAIAAVKSQDPNVDDRSFFLNVTNCKAFPIYKFLNGQNIAVRDTPKGQRYATRSEVDAAVSAGFKFPQPDAGNGLYVVIDEWNPTWTKNATVYYRQAQNNCR